MREKSKKSILKDEFREHLIGQARDIFARNGFQKTNLNDIATVSGKGKSTLYYYFPGKEEIFKAVVESELNELRQKITEQVEMAADPQAKLKAYVITRINHLSQFQNLVATIRDHPTSRYTYRGTIREKFEAMEVELLMNILNGGVQQGYFKINEPQFAATGLIAALRGVHLQKLNGAPKPDFDKNLDNLLEILLFGLIK